MDLADLAFTSHHIDWLPANDRCFQEMLLGALWLSLRGLTALILSAFATLKSLLSPVAAHMLNPVARCVCKRLYTHPFEYGGGVRATIRRDIVKQDDRKQGFPTLVLRRGYACQTWFAQLPSQSESGA